MSGFDVLAADNMDRARKLGSFAGKVSVARSWLMSLQRDLPKLTVEEVAAELDSVIADLAAAQAAAFPPREPITPQETL